MPGPWLRPGPRPKIRGVTRWGLLPSPPPPPPLPIFSGYALTESPVTYLYIL